MHERAPSFGAAYVFVGHAVQDAVNSRKKPIFVAGAERLRPLRRMSSASAGKQMKTMKILILNGPNLNLQGRRDVAVYGSTSFGEYLERLRAAFPDVELDYLQSNVEGELIDALHRSEGRYDGVALNAGGYTHTSVALCDAVAAVTTPVVEVHISSILAREEFRRVSLLAPVVRGSIMGFGLDSYRLGVEALLLLKSGEN